MKAKLFIVFCAGLLLSNSPARAMETTYSQFESSINRATSLPELKNIESEIRKITDRRVLSPQDKTDLLAAVQRKQQELGQGTTGGGQQAYQQFQARINAATQDSQLSQINQEITAAVNQGNVTPDQATTLRGMIKSKRESATAQQAYGQLQTRINAATQDAELSQINQSISAALTGQAITQDQATTLRGMIKARRDSMRQQEVATSPQAVKQLIREVGGLRYDVSQAAKSANIPADIQKDVVDFVDNQPIPRR